MQQPWIPAVGFLAIAVVIAMSLVGLSLALRVRARKPVPTTGDTYECGEEPDGLAWVRFHPRYYVIALVFVLFDVETVFLLPWALNIRPLGSLAIIEMTLFIGILLLGWLYALRKGALRWQ
ncbi:MAG: NADH-quinone oxidoreductase subunit A [Candidatus Eisenbacteria bacterium]